MHKPWNERVEKVWCVMRNILHLIFHRQQYWPCFIYPFPIVNGNGWDDLIPRWEYISIDRIDRWKMKVDNMNVNINWQYDTKLSRGVQVIDMTFTWSVLTYTVEWLTHWLLRLYRPAGCMSEVATSRTQTAPPQWSTSWSPAMDSWRNIDKDAIWRW